MIPVSAGEISAVSLDTDVAKAGRIMPEVPLAQAICDRSAVVGVVGLGYVGLPLLRAVCAEGFRAIGVDKDESKVRSLRSGRSYIGDVSDDDIIEIESCTFTADQADLRGADVIILTVPTPLTDSAPDLSLVRRACLEVATILSPGQLIVLESTTYPGTTEEVVRPILESSGLTAGRDFALAYSPERIDPGSSRTLKSIPKIVSGIDQASSDLAALFYSRLASTVVQTPSPRDAEMAKLIENTFRQVNIALVNELATLAPEIGVDIWAALDAAATKPFGFMPFWPGPGVGGHCIAIDPTYLSWRVGQRLGFGIGFIEHATRVNNSMPAYVATRIGDALNGVGKPLNGAHILALGLSYKADVGDIRESPAVGVVERLARAGAHCSYHDPFVPEVRILGETLQSQLLNQTMLRRQDCVAILTPHTSIDYEAIADETPLLFDAAGVTRYFDATSVVRL
jgi:UDP-N-acetyl-D-glucosamine dehydrogenase